MQERSDYGFFVQPALRREHKCIDPIECTIGSIAHKRLDRSNDLKIGTLSQGQERWC